VALLPSGSIVLFSPFVNMYTHDLKQPIPLGSFIFKVIKIEPEEDMLKLLQEQRYWIDKLSNYGDGKK